MQGATDGGKHIEALRTEHMSCGPCQLCRKWQDHLERHHESYNPERVIFLCHHCHHRAHFRPYHLSDKEKEKLLQVRHGPLQWTKFAAKQRLREKLINDYIAPGRRSAQLGVRQKMRQEKVVERRARVR